MAEPLTPTFPHPKPLMLSLSKREERSLSQGLGSSMPTGASPNACAILTLRQAQDEGRGACIAWHWPTVRRLA